MNEETPTLDEAWADAEAALPRSGWPSNDGRWVIPDRGWTIAIRHLESGDGYFEPHEEGYEARLTVDGPQPYIRSTPIMNTPTAALQALAVSLASLRSDHKELRT